MDVEKEITAEQLFNTIIEINKQLQNMNECYKLLRGSDLGSDKKARSMKILDAEINKLEEKLRIFKSTDVGVIKNTVYSTEFDGEICKTLYGEA